MIKIEVQEKAQIKDVENKVKDNQYVKTKKIFSIVFYRYEYSLTEEMKDPKVVHGNAPIGFTSKHP